jgi:hypothetical protein
MLGWKMFLNTVRIRTASSYKMHLGMALKILETPPDVVGDIVECGTYQGGSAANLSLVAAIVGRKVRIYDSFEGLPPGVPGDREAHFYKPGDYRGSLPTVKRNIRRYGSIENCEFVQGWFDDTLPKHTSPIVLTYVDVDLEASLHTCVLNLWPHLTEKGYFFIDEFTSLNYCSLFFSEKWWDRYLGTTPPGLMGTGTGVALGNYYLGPWSEHADHPRHGLGGLGYTRKDLYGYWTYFPDEAASAQD